jgi:phenylacetate-CoA ligase
VAGVLKDNPVARRATLTPPVCNGLVCFSNWHSPSARTVGHTLFVNLARIPFVLGEVELARMAGETSNWAPTFLDLDPVHGAWFALYCERHGLRFPSLRFNLCSYEFVSVIHRRIIERVFGVPVFNLYGSTEAGHLLMENERGELTPCLENASYEIVEPDERGIGDLVVTTWTNEFMPLLRYRTGDLAQRLGDTAAPHYLVHGRSREGWRRCDGRRVTTLEIDQCFQGVAGMAHYHLRQTGPDAGQLQFVPDRVPPEAADLKQVSERLQELLQLPQPIQVEVVEKLPPLASGKFRLTQGL